VIVLILASQVAQIIGVNLGYFKFVMGWYALRPIVNQRAFICIGKNPYEYGISMLNSYREGITFTLLIFF
jgi:hypothetical protein